MPVGNVMFTFCVDPKVAVADGTAATVNGLPASPASVHEHQGKLTKLSWKKTLVDVSPDKPVI